MKKLFSTICDGKGHELLWGAQSARIRKVSDLPCGGVPPFAFRIGVSKPPATMVLTRMLRPANSRAASVMPMSAA